VNDPLDRLRSALGDRYDLDRQIGEGGMATVYRAKDVKHERTVAIKVLREELSASIGADRFLREIRVAANLQHPHILGLYDSGQADGLLYYVMPFVDGESLRDRLNKHQQLPLLDALQIVREAAEALQYAHEHGVVHRDIKPENILLQGGHALVADFGIARAVSRASDEKLTQTGMAIGTPHYMSPEQSLGSEYVDARSDVYSLGCVLYEVLIGQPPFTGPNSMAILARHSMEVVPSLQVVRASVPDDVEDTVMQALEKTPADRFQTMKEFAERLSDSEAEAAIARTSQRRNSAAMTARRSSGARAVTGARRQSRDIETRGSRFRGSKFWSLAGGGLLLVAAAGLGIWKFTHHSEATRGDDGLDPKHIGVMYFERRGGADSLGYLADGLTEALIHELSQVRELQVISRNGVLPYKKTTLAPDSIGKALGVGTLVEGTVTEADKRLRVNVSLINASTGTEIGDKVLERPREEIFALQDDLAKEVAIFLRERLGQVVELKASRLGSRSVAAWELLQQAEQVSAGADPLIDAGDNAAAGRHLAQADSILARAETADPQWATPIVKRGWLAYRQSRLAASLDKGYYAEWTERGLAHAERALKLRPDDSDGLELRGTLRYWRWLLNLAPGGAESAKLLADAEQDLQRAVSLNPNQATAWNSLSHMFLAKAQNAEAKLAALRAYEADPYLRDANKTVWRLFQSSLDLEDRVEATHWCGEGKRRFPRDPRFAECQLWLLALKGEKPNVPEIWKLVDEYVQLSPPKQRDFIRLRGQMLATFGLARAGLADSARAVAVRSRASASQDPPRELVYFEALLRSILNDRDEALSLLSTYIATNPQVRSNIARDESWWFHDLRQDRRYKELIGS
jgi:eukaryotic-like serine/threonine-protein kinase